MKNLLTESDMEWIERKRAETKRYKKLFKKAKTDTWDLPRSLAIIDKIMTMVLTKLCQDRRKK